MWFAITITVTPGTPQRITKGSQSAERLLITPLLGASAGAVLVVNQSIQVTPMVTNANTTVTELAPATTTGPGGTFFINRLTQGPPINVQEYGIDGAHADTVQVAWEVN